MSDQTPPVILTIAGSDSGGGAGIQADLKTIAMLGGYGASVITALTAQNTVEVRGIHAPPAEFVALQLACVLDDLPVRAVKTGMLFNSEIIQAVAKGLDGFYGPLVVDPVCVSQTGHRLLEEDAIKTLREEMLPLATLVTPNKPEAEALTGMTIDSRESLFKAMDEILSWGAHAVLVKGGHFGGGQFENEKGGDEAFLKDWLQEQGAQPLAMRVPRVETKNTHGTGCTLSAAIATGLGLGHRTKPAVLKAQDYLNKALRSAWPLGQGFGPPDHSHPLTQGQAGKRT